MLLATIMCLPWASPIRNGDLLALFNWEERVEVDRKRRCIEYIDCVWGTTAKDVNVRQYW